jgi:DNA-binding transcriptional LysR family regulator
LTEGGRLLLQLAHPLVAGFDSLKRQFQESLGMVRVHVTVATTPRPLAEDLSKCVIEFEQEWPNVQLTFHELRDEDVSKEVEAGNADVGLVGMPQPQGDDPWLEYELCYEVDTVLITPQDHPLARRRYVRPCDLRPYPLVNSPNAFRDPAIRILLEKLGLFRTQPRHVEAFFTATIQRYVELGFGIGLIPRLPSFNTYPNLHQRVMSQYFGRAGYFLIWRKGELRPPAAVAFAASVRAQLNKPPIRPRRRTKATF